jgi:hypothetical protein
VSGRTIRRPVDAVDVRPDTSDVMTAILRMRTADLKAGGDPELRVIVHEAFARGDGILIAGCAPSNVALSTTDWRARATVVISGSSERLVIDLRGRVGDAIRIDSARLVERLPR